MTDRDPYADLSEVYAEETSLARIRVRTTPKTPTEPVERIDSPADGARPQ